jgi:release factor glutamine methyltransferase
VAAKPRRRRSADPGRASLGAWRRDARAQLRSSGIQNAAGEADFIVAHVLGLSRIELTLNRDRVLDARERRRLSRILSRRQARVPMQYLLQDVDFSGLHLEVRRGVFIPRPETEGLVERILARVGPKPLGWVAEVGTGTGAIALALAAARPGLRVMATDISPAAVRQARRNARQLGLEDRVRFFQGDLTRPLERRRRTFAGNLLAVVSNPPYVAWQEKKRLPPEVVEHEPHEALFAREDGLAIIRRLVARAAALLPGGGLLALEIGERQGDRVERLLKDAAHWDEIRIERDLAGRERYALARRRPAEEG